MQCYTKSVKLRLCINTAELREISMYLPIIAFLTVLNCFSTSANTTARASSYPYISGDTLRAFADVIIDETTATVSVDTIKKGDIIFVKTDYLGFFFSEI